MLEKIEIIGFRGFSKLGKIELAIPNGKEGSGLTILVGSNNSGKTSILEAIKFSNVNGATTTFSIGKRNVKNNSNVSIKYFNINEYGERSMHELKTVSRGGNYMEGTPSLQQSIYYVQSRRQVPYYSGASNSFDRNRYLENGNRRVDRTGSLDNFYTRLNWINNNTETKNVFDNLLLKLFGKKIEWNIDQEDNGQFFINYSFGECHHNSEGIGDGVWSLFTIIDSFYDSQKNDLIIIDEPELSLHPDLQKNVLSVLMEYSKDRQIILATHSPYFINWESLFNGGKLIRTIKDEEYNIKINPLSEEIIEKIKKNIFNNICNPHVFGINACEVFFLRDNLILVEGQEDVIVYKKLIKELNVNINAEFFGWGVAGADRMQYIIEMLISLGYKKVLCIYDRNKNERYDYNRKHYKKYKHKLLFKDDIRDKEENGIITEEGVCTSRFEIKEENRKAIIEFIKDIKNYFEP